MLQLHLSDQQVYCLLRFPLILEVWRYMSLYPTRKNFKSLSHSNVEKSLKMQSYMNYHVSYNKFSMASVNGLGSINPNNMSACQDKRQSMNGQSHGQSHDHFPDKYHKTSKISHTLVGNKIVDHSDVVGALPVDAAPTASSFSFNLTPGFNRLQKVFTVCLASAESFLVWVKPMRDNAT